MARIKKLPNDMTPQERQIILWLGSGELADEEGYTGFHVLIDKAQQAGWSVFHAFDQLRLRWGAVEQPKGTDANRYALTQTGEQYYDILKAQGVAKTEATAPTTYPTKPTARSTHVAPRGARGSARGKA